MGREQADVGRDAYATASWRGQLHQPGDGSGVALSVVRGVAIRPVASVGGSLAAGLERAAMQFSWTEAVALASLAILGLEFLKPLAYHLPDLRAATEGVITLMVITGALMISGQFVHTRRRRDLNLVTALVALGLLEFTSDALPTALQIRPSAQSAAALLVGQLLVAAVVCAAALTPSTQLVTSARQPILRAVGFGIVGFGAAELAGFILNGTLVATALNPLPGIGHALSQPLATAIVIGTAILLLEAAGCLTFRGRVEGKGALPILGAAAILLAASQLYFFAIPWVPAGWITPRELMRFVAVALIVLAAVREERDLRGGIARAAATAERRQVAGDLHDGLAQDLALIAAHGAKMTSDLGAEHPLTLAARRALAVTRLTISDLCDSSSCSVREALEALAHELGGHFGIAVAVAVDADSRAELSPEAREHVLRIVREAVANAARHGHAENVTVSLGRCDGAFVLRVCDDGSGISSSSSSAPQEGFGLRCIRERAATLGGRLTTGGPAHGGTELEVIFP